MADGEKSLKSQQSTWSDAAVDVRIWKSGHPVQSSVFRSGQDSADSKKGYRLQ